ncbi:hypothetical protein NP233_g6863 [Leucocoprinus birnbaumii]|uniref:Uncharacterized protein n=1 Tax=Leucocoprinus birnbaumii TaxID=56174 RepID=A0AAD5VRE0_9AGAR|nr:hypothetical protein NP233_g6863 [Leucocoprinus birnbaumii]
MKFSLLSALAVAAFSCASAVVVPGADTPTFYLVASSTSSPSNLLPLRTTGGSNGYSTLTGSGPIGQFYFYQGQLVAAGSTPAGALIAAIPLSSCTTYGQLGFSVSNTDKCAQRNTFAIQSDSENSQLGAKLSFNFVGGFYSCGSGQDVWYMVSPGDAPGLSCQPIDLWTVPVA